MSSRHYRDAGHRQDSSQAISVGKDGQILALANVYWGFGIISRVVGWSESVTPVEALFIYRDPLKSRFGRHRTSLSTPGDLSVQVLLGP